MSFAAAILMASAAALQAATPAIPSPSPTPQPTDAQRVARASALGWAIHAFDRAAWVATDALEAKGPSLELLREGGWIVEPGRDRSLIVTFYSGKDASAAAIFTAHVVDFRVTASHSLTPALPLTAEQQRLARARNAAAAEAASRGLKPCTPGPFNTVVLPAGADDGSIYVYLLSSQLTDAYPVGGHFRMLVGKDDKVISARPFSISCLNLERPKLPPGATPVGFTVTSLLDTVPTEIHVFTSLAARMPVYVATKDRRLWKVAGTAITQVPARP